jgi:hypothetical protein
MSKMAATTVLKMKNILGARGGVCRGVTAVDKRIS